MQKGNDIAEFVEKRQPYKYVFQIYYQVLSPNLGLNSNDSGNYLGMIPSANLFVISYSPLGVT